MSDQPYFDVLMNMTDEEAKEAQVPLTKRSLKRQLQSGFDNAAGEIIDKESAIHKEYQALRKYGIKDFNLNLILSYRQIIAQLKEKMELAKAEYRHLFGEELPTGE